MGEEHAAHRMVGMRQGEETRGEYVGGAYLVRRESAEEPKRNSGRKAAARAGLGGLAIGLRAARRRMIGQIVSIVEQFLLTRLDGRLGGNGLAHELVEIAAHVVDGGRRSGGVGKDPRRIGGGQARGAVPGGV